MQQQTISESRQDLKYLEMTLRYFGITLTMYGVHIVAKAYELIQKKSGESSISDLVELEFYFKREYQILHSLIPDVIWDVD